MDNKSFSQQIAELLNFLFDRWRRQKWRRWRMPTQVAKQPSQQQC